MDVARVLEDEAENLDIAGHGLRSDLLDDDRNRLDRKGLAGGGGSDGLAGGGGGDGQLAGLGDGLSDGQLAGLGDGLSDG